MNCVNSDIDHLVSTVTAEIPQFSVLSEPKHLSLYNNGHLAGLLHSLHCGNTPPARDPFDDLHNRDIVHLVRALQLRSPQFSALSTQSTSHWTQRACQRLCPRLQIRRCMSTGTSITVDELPEEDIDDPDMHKSRHVRNRVQELDTQSPRRRRGTAGTAAA